MKNLKNKAPVSIDTESLTAAAGGKIVRLAPKEVSLLQSLIKVYPRHATRRAVLIEMYGKESASDDSAKNSLRVHLGNLRGKLKRINVSITTVKTQGFKIAQPESRP